MKIRSGFQKNVEKLLGNDFINFFQNMINVNNLTDKAKLKFNLCKLLLTMDVPERRYNDFKWLSRNIGIQNADHPNYNKCMDILKDLMT